MPLLLPFLPDFTEPATETFQFQTSVTNARRGTERREAVWSQPRRDYELTVAETPEFNAGLLQWLRTHPDAVTFPAWHFSGRPCIQGSPALGERLYCHYNQHGTLVNDDPATPAGYAETAPMLTGYPDTELAAQHDTDGIRSIRLKVRVPPYLEDIPDWDAFDEATGEALFPDFVHWNEGVAESLKRSENLSESNTALYAVERRFGERFISVNVACFDDEATRRLRSFLLYIRGAARAFRLDALDGMRTWRLAEDKVTLTYGSDGMATTSLTMKELQA